ncbi:MAG: DUF4330 domain-containing protein [Defluviitaleaceae bacterium]|nr:DUF4330 domain-containing protein [Defluviitaleaceae bacterium]
MIDRDARLFGKINIIDAVLILALVGAIIFGVNFIRGGGAFIGGESREFIIGFHSPEVDDFSATIINIGDNAFDHILGNFLGEVYDVVVGPSVVWNVDQYGNSVLSTMEGFSELTVYVRITGTPDNHGVLVAGNRYGVGMNRALRAGAAAMQMRVSYLREITP